MTTDAEGTLSMASGDQRRIHLFAVSPGSRGVLALRPNTLDASPRPKKPLSRRYPRRQAVESLRRASFNAECMYRELREAGRAPVGAER
jgi:hypothetical protein